MELSGELADLGLKLLLLALVLVEQLVHLLTLLLFGARHQLLLLLHLELLILQSTVQLLQLDLLVIHESPCLGRLELFLLELGLEDLRLLVLLLDDLRELLDLLPLLSNDLLALGHLLVKLLLQTTHQCIHHLVSVSLHCQVASQLAYLLLVFAHQVSDDLIFLSHDTANLLNSIDHLSHLHLLVLDMLFDRLQPALLALDHLVHLGGD